MGKILIIDDEAVFRRVISEALRRKGHAVREADNTEEGFRLALELLPDLIVSDVCMEGGDGLSLLKTIRADTRTSAIPFVVMTGQPNFEGMLRGTELAADGYLPKPFELKTLLSTVENRLVRENAFRDSVEEVKEQLQRILEASPDLIAILDPKALRFQFLNAAGRALLGIGPGDDISSLGIHEIHSPDAARIILREAIPTAVREGLWAGENTIQAANGQQFPVKQYFQAHRDHAGKIAFLSTIAHDLTETKAAEAAIRASENKFRSLVDALPDAVVMHDESGHIVFANARTEQLFGYSPEELAGRPVSSFFGETSNENHSERRCWRKSGEEFPVDLVVTELGTMGGQTRLNIIRDLSERKRMERERQNIELQLRQALKLESIGQLAAGIAHEINTPTQYIGDNTRFLHDAFGSLSKLLPEFDKLLAAARAGTLTPELVAEVEQASREADLEYLSAEIPLAIQQSLEGVDRVSKIVRAMKDFSHPGVTEKTLADLNHLIESTITVARNEWKYVADLETDLAPDLPLVPCLPGEFNQVILNLLINAAHAIADATGDGSREKGKIRVTTAKGDTSVEIRVSDSGTGIPEHVRQRIFEPFFTTKQVGKGTGQGLAIARSVVVDKHGGRIDFETEIGKGTTFVIQLPLKEHSPGKKLR